MFCLNTKDFIKDYIHKDPIDILNNKILNCFHVNSSEENVKYESENCFDFNKLRLTEKMNIINYECYLRNYRNPLYLTYEKLKHQYDKKRYCYLIVISSNKNYREKKDCCIFTFDDKQFYFQCSTKNIDDYPKVEFLEV